MNITSSPSMLLALPIFLIACAASDQTTASLDAAAFAERIGTSDAQLVDVRTAAEYANGHIADAVNLDWTSGQLEERSGDLDKSKPVLLYCASGRRSASAREHLREQGFTDVVDLAGGIKAWADAGKAIDR